MTKMATRWFNFMEMKYTYVAVNLLGLVSNLSGTHLRFTNEISFLAIPLWIREYLRKINLRVKVSSLHFMINLRNLILDL